MSMSKGKIQIIKRSYDLWDVYVVSKVDGELTGHYYEPYARIVLDLELDRFFIEKPLWNDANEWHRIEKPYLVVQAAINAIVNPRAPE